MSYAFLPVFLFLACAVGLAVGLLVFSRLLHPNRPDRVADMPYESGMDPIHDSHRRFHVRFYLMAIAFLIFDVELLFLYPWAIASGELRGQGMVASGQNLPSPTDGSGPGGERGSKIENAKPLPSALTPTISRERAMGSEAPHSPFPTFHSHRPFIGAMIFLFLLALGFVYDWRRGVFRW
jgi:NADH-quinone oxidoreductase subunit A